MHTCAHIPGDDSSPPLVTECPDALLYVCTVYGADLVIVHVSPSVPGLTCGPRTPPPCDGGASDVWTPDSRHVTVGRPRRGSEPWPVSLASLSRRGDSLTRLPTPSTRQYTVDSIVLRKVRPEYAGYQLDASDNQMTEK